MPSHRSQSLGQREIARIDQRLASRPVLAPRLREHLRNRPVAVVEFLAANGQEAVPA
ncbi:MULTISPECIES: hypothetical protein [unclassified Streptomyces]|uniref:hypothetical protein n=1 Tax=unclassified Streptomyces TaxID=2593676 RepID=UPI0033B38FBE